MRFSFLGRSWRPVTVVVILFAAVCVGAVVDARWAVVRGLVNMLEGTGATRLDGFDIDGDPALTVVDAADSAGRLPPPNEEGALRTWQANLRSRLRSDLFGLPSPGPAPEPLVLSRVEVGGGLSREFVSFTSFDGTSIPAFVFRHSPGGRRPAILVLSGHVRPGDSGIDQTAGLVNSYQHGAALELARAGFVVMTIESRGFGYLGPPHAPEHRTVAYNAVAAGSFYRAVIAHDIQVAVSMLAADSQVDAFRIGLAGVSLGGEMVTTYVALDERVAAAVVQGYGGRTGQPERSTGLSIADQPHYCHVVPGQARWFDDEDLFLLIAPRPLLVVRGSREFMPDPAWQAALSAGYRLLRRPEALEVRRETGGHEFFVTPAVAFLTRHLNDGR